MKCSYCDQEEIDDIQERIICEEKDKKWSAFVPLEPEIFGHIIVNYLNYVGHKNWYLFCWDNVSENDSEDSEKLRGFLRDDLGIEWAKNAKIGKSSDGMTITISTYKKSADIMVDEKKEKATLKISDGITHDLKVKKEKGKLTIYKKCIRDISSADDIDQKILNSLMEGVRIISNKLKNIDNVDRVYVVMTGEDPSAHVHFHLFPRYGFLNNNEIAKWAEKNGLSKGEIDWRRFYANPTKNFKYHHDFSYLGEIQQKYDDWKMNKMNGKPPSKELLIEMKEKLGGILLMGCPICSGSLLSDDFSVIEKQGRRVIIQGNVHAIYGPRQV